jgi:hypothetical protein
MEPLLSRLTRMKRLGNRSQWSFMHVHRTVYSRNVPLGMTVTRDSLIYTRLGVPWLSTYERDAQWSKN